MSECIGSDMLLHETRCTFCSSPSLTRLISPCRTSTISCKPTLVMGGREEPPQNDKLVQCNVEAIKYNANQRCPTFDLTLLSLAGR